MGVLRFPAFLPGDDSPGRAGAGAGAGALVEALGALLRLPSQGFWDEAVHSRELRDALDSFLRFRRRAADGPGRRGGDRAADPATEALVRRVFAVFLRLVEGSGASSCVTGEPGPEERGALLRDLGLVDAARALDICALYEPANPDLCRRLMRGLLTLQPQYFDDFSLAFHQLAQHLAALRPLKELVGPAAGPGAADREGAGERPFGSGKRPAGSDKRPISAEASSSGRISASGSGSGSGSASGAFPGLGSSNLQAGRPGGTPTGASNAALCYALDLAASLSALLRAAPGLGQAFRASGLLPVFQSVYEEALPALAREELADPLL